MNSGGRPGHRDQDVLPASSQPVVHLELHTHDLPGAQALYAELCGWRVERIDVGPGSYLALALGGTLATCVDTAAWYAAASASPGDWLVTSLQLDALRLARREPHRVTARCIRAGRTRAVVDVAIASEAEPERVVGVGRVNLARTATDT